MTHQRLSEILKLMAWGPSALAAEVSVSERTVRRWLTGESPVPPRLHGWLEHHAAYRLAHPAPAINREDWQ